MTIPACPKFGSEVITDFDQNTVSVRIGGVYIEYMVQLKFGSPFCVKRTLGILSREIKGLTRPGVDKVKPKGWFKYSLLKD